MCSVCIVQQYEGIDVCQLLTASSPLFEQATRKFSHFDHKNKKIIQETNA